MRVCPECGYVDPPYWRHSYFRPFIDICHIDDFRLMHPKLATELTKWGNTKKGRFVEDKLYKYRLTKARNIVERIAKIDSPTKSFRGADTEKPRKYLPLSQKKLFEICPKTTS